jgi:hypothetical protein
VPIALAALALTLGIVWGRRGGPAAKARAAAPSSPRPVPADDPDTLAQAIAALDAAAAGRADASPAVRDAYQRRRTELKARLVDALDAVDAGAAHR